MSDIRTQIVAIVLDTCSKRPPDLSDAKRSFADCGLDSLDVTTVLMEAERVFDITIPDADLNNIDSIAALEDYIARQKQGRE